MPSLAVTIFVDMKDRSSGVMRAIPKADKVRGGGGGSGGGGWRSQRPGNSSKSALPYSVSVFKDRKSIWYGRMMRSFDATYRSSLHPVTSVTPWPGLLMSRSSKLFGDYRRWIDRGSCRAF